MNRANNLCETSNCGNAAIVFGMKGSLKFRSCGDHMPSLIDKGMQVFEISGFDFICTFQDAMQFEERKAQVEKGRGNLAVLEASCELELNQALTTIQNTKDSAIRAVESRFEEMKIAVTSACAEAKRQLGQVQGEFERYFASKENQLSLTAELACLNLKVNPLLLKFGIADASSAVSAALSDIWAVSTPDLASALKHLNPERANEVIEETLTETAEYAKIGLLEPLRYASLLIGDQQSFEQGKDILLSEFLKVEKERIAKNFKWLHRSWCWRQQLSDKETVAVGQQLASMLCHQQGKFSEADALLRKCLEATQEQSALSMSLGTDLCGVYFASAQFQQTQQAATWILTTYWQAKLPAELYWTVIFYLIFSMKWQNQLDEASNVLESWWQQDMGEISKLAEMLQSLTCGIATFYDLKHKDAENWLLKALKVGKIHFPTSIFTAVGCYYFARVKEREDYYRKAQSIYEVAAPMSVHAAINLNFLGELLIQKQQYEMAEECLTQAQPILTVAAPKSVAAGNNLLHMGQLFEARQQSAQAISYFQNALSIYSENEEAFEKLDAEEAISRLRNS